MMSEGADIIDVGGESTRPGSRAVPEREEIARVIPLVERLVELGCTISVDTSKPAVMRAAISAGADMINDVNGFRADGAVEAVCHAGVATCVMHMKGTPRNMQSNPVYADVVAEVGCFLKERARTLLDAGVRADRIVIDPGFGFGKTLTHNLTMLSHLERFMELGYPLLAGISRKSMIGALLGDRPVGERLYGSLASAVIAAMKGASILRVHDVAPTVDALRVAGAVIEKGKL
jgi:dihydropteroate synthase